MNGFLSGAGGIRFSGPDLVGRAALKTRFPVRLPRLNGPSGTYPSRRPFQAGCLRSAMNGALAPRVRKTDLLEQDPFQGPFQVHKRDELSLPGMEQFKDGVSFV